MNVCHSVFATYAKMYFTLVCPNEQIDQNRLVQPFSAFLVHRMILMKLGVCGLEIKQYS